jgi:hypothetical protein
VQPDLPIDWVGFLSSCEAEDAALLTQSKDMSEAGRQKDKQ